MTFEADLKLKVMLQINYSKGIYNIKGSLMAGNCKNLKRHFETLINANETVILNLDYVDKMDAHAIQIISMLRKKAIEKNSVFYAIGKNKINID